MGAMLVPTVIVAKGKIEVLDAKGSGFRHRHLGTDAEEEAKSIVMITWARELHVDVRKPIPRRCVDFIVPPPDSNLAERLDERIHGHVSYEGAIQRPPLRLRIGAEVERLSFKRS